MIVEWFLGVVEAVVGALLGALPVVEPPAWFKDADGAMQTFVGYFADMGHWMPVNLMVTVFLAVLGSVVIGFGIKVVRIVLSFATAGGGSAG